MNQKIRAVIFDMDGVLFASEREYLKHLTGFMTELGGHWNDEQLQRFCGISGEEHWALMQEMLPCAMERGEFYRMYGEYYQKYPVEYDEIVEKDAGETLRELKRRGFVLALASSSSMKEIEAALTAGRIKEYFDLLVSGSNFKRSKPDPEIYSYTMKKLGLPAEKCVVVEDSIYGIQAALRAGITQVIRKENPGYFMGSGDTEYKINHLGELLNFSILQSEEQ